MENEVTKISEENNLEQSSQAELPKQKTKFKTESGLFGFLFIFSIAFLLSIYFLNIFVTPIKVVGASMQPTINTQIINDSDEEHCDVVYYKKSNSYSNGNIIIMTNPDKKYIASDNVNYLIKRIIACPGQTIKFIPSETGQPILINSKIYYTIEVYDESENKILDQEDYIKEDMYYLKNQDNHRLSLEYPNTFGLIFSSLLNGDAAEFVIGENQYFVMGDNRNNSTDSRIFGCVDNEDIAGNVELRVPYGETLIQSLFDKMKLLLERCL